MVEFEILKLITTASAFITIDEDSNSNPKKITLITKPQRLNHAKLQTVNMTSLHFTLKLCRNVQRVTFYVQEPGPSIWWLQFWILISLSLVTTVSLSYLFILKFNLICTLFFLIFGASIKLFIFDILLYIGCTVNLIESSPF